MLAAGGPFHSRSVVWESSFPQATSVDAGCQAAVDQPGSCCWMTSWDISGKKAESSIHPNHQGHPSPSHPVSDCEEDCGAKPFTVSAPKTGLRNGTCTWAAQPDAYSGQGCRQKKSFPPITLNKDIFVSLSVLHPIFCSLIRAGAQHELKETLEIICISSTCLVLLHREHVSTQCEDPEGSQKSSQFL